MGVTTTVDITAIQGFSDCLRQAPRTLLRELAGAYRSIGRSDIDKIRANVSGEFNLTSKGAANSFKFKATDPSKATDFSKLFTSEYTGWKAADVFQTGGQISGKGKKLTVLTPDARNASGKRKFTQADLRNMIASRQVQFIPTPRRVIIVQILGGWTKGGKVKKNSGKQVVLGFLKQSVTERKRLDFYEVQEAGASIHQELLEYAVENTLVEIATSQQK